MLSSLVVYVARRALSSGRLRTGRMCLVAALVLAAFVLALRIREYRALVSDGVSPWNLRTSVFDDADVYYLHAVKERLRQLARDLESRLANRPASFSDADHRRLSVVTALQASLVGWTELEVGHWLDDTQLRRDLIEVVAFQIHPTARRRDAARRRVEVEQGDMLRRRQCFLVLRDYCRRPPSGDPQQAEGLAEALRRLGAGQWAYADAVVGDVHDATMIGERLNQIELSLTSIDARGAFVREYLDPLWDAPAAPGLNRKFPGLRLPISLPQARAWTVSYALITGLHSVILLLAALTLLGPLLRRGLPAHDPPLASRARCWHATVAMGIVVFLCMYCC